MKPPIAVILLFIMAGSTNLRAEEDPYPTYVTLNSVKTLDASTVQVIYEISGSSGSSAGWVLYDLNQSIVVDYQTFQGSLTIGSHTTSVAINVSFGDYEINLSASSSNGGSTAIFQFTHGNRPTALSVNPYPSGTIPNDEITFGVSSANGVSHCKYKVDDGYWSSPIPVGQNPLVTIGGLVIGVHTLYVQGGFGELEDPNTWIQTPSTFSWTAALPQNVLPTGNKNYILTAKVLTPIDEENSMSNLDDDEISQSIAYSDGMGRLIQGGVIKGSPSEKDVITHSEYDIRGRQTKKFVPYVSVEDDGAFRSGAATELATFYQTTGQGIATTDHPFSEAKYENSPLSRVLEEGSPGTSWQPNTNDYNGHTTKRWQRGNASGEVIKWTASGGTEGTYGAGELLVTRTVDENGDSSCTYEDKSGKTILKKSINGTDTVRTYYVYDDFGNLSFIIPPMACVAMNTNWVVTSSIWHKWITAFKYDSHNRLIEKRIPEAGTIFTVYDRLGRVAVTQDSLLRRQHSWMFTKYDQDGRAVLTGTLHDNIHLSRQSMQEFLESGARPLVQLYDNQETSFTTGVKQLTFSKPINAETSSIRMYTAGFDVPGGPIGECEGVNMMFRYKTYNEFGQESDWQNVSSYDQTIVLTAMETAVTIQGDILSNPNNCTVRLLLNSTSYVPDEANISLFEMRDSASFSKYHGYSNHAFPNIDSCEVWTVTYYDDYDFNYDGIADSAYVSDGDFPANSAFNRLKGKVTGTKTLVQNPVKSPITYSNGQIVIEGEYTSGAEVTIQVSDSNQYKPVQWLTSVPFYDKYGRVIQTQSTNALGGTDITHTEYDFPGKVLKTKTVHQTVSASVTVRKRFEYDHAGRLLKTYQQNNSDSEILVSSLAYNELGQLIEKNLHSTNGGTTFLQSVDMRYNIRGWLKTINDETLTSESSDLFGMKLHYETTVSGLNGSSAEAQFNGNIAAQEWNVKTRGRRGYGYTYDKLNQLLNAKYAAYNDEIFNYVLDVNRFTESMTYDLNGNILSINRNGKNSWAGQGTYGAMDQLSYTYTGNRLIGVDDAIDDIANNNKYDFSDNSHQGSVQEGNPGTWEYQYDGNGNMISDANKGISVSYNFLNLPTKVNFGAGDSIVWVYTVSGAKLRKTVYDNGQVQTTIDYVSGYQYKNGSLDFFAMEAGRVKKTTSGSLRYEYNLTDHLGNTRVSFSDTNSDGTAEILQEDHYYAFGLRIEGLSSTTKDNKFTYNGKELEGDQGLGWYHYGARYYDPQVGRWHVVDPNDENHSPYSYVGNKPLIAVDPSGKDTWYIHGTSTKSDGFSQEAGENWTAVFGETTEQAHKFPWNTPSFFQSNQSSTRMEAATRLANQLISFKKDNPDAPLNIVAHSHGGNVAIIAANLINEQGYRVDNLIIIGTPENGTKLSEGAAGAFISVYSEDDAVQVIGGDWFQTIAGEVGPAGREHKGAFNLAVTNIEGVRNGKDLPHSNMHENPSVIGAISNWIWKVFGNDE